MLFWNSVANNLIWQKRCTIPAMLHKQVFWRKWLFMFNMLLYSLVHIHIYVILYNNINNQQWNVEQGVELYIYDLIVIPSEGCQPPPLFLLYMYLLLNRDIWLEPSFLSWVRTPCFQTKCVWYLYGEEYNKSRKMIKHEDSTQSSRQVNFWYRERKIVVRNIGFCLHLMQSLPKNLLSIYDIIFIRLYNIPGFLNVRIFGVCAVWQKVLHIGASSAGLSLATNASVLSSGSTTS